MSTVRSLGIFVGTGECNARCAHCAGVPLRKDAPKKDGEVDEALILNTLKDCHAQGARSLTLSSGGEPTLSPESITKVLFIIRKSGLNFDKISLYTNGIRIGTDEEFCDTYLAYWNVLGLTDIHMTVHDTYEVANAAYYHVPYYPELLRVVDRIHRANLKVRANLVLRRRGYPRNDTDFYSCIRELKTLGFDSATAWPLRDIEHDRLHPTESLPDEVLQSMAEEAKQISEGNCQWLENEGFPVTVYLEEHRDMHDRGEKLTLFPNGTLSNTWCG